MRFFTDVKDLCPCFFMNKNNLRNKYLEIALLKQDVLLPTTIKLG